MIKNFCLKETNIYLNCIIKGQHRIYFSKMPKKKSTPAPTTQSTGIKDNSPISLDKSGNIVLKILAKPGAKQNVITDITNDGIGIQISAPPIDGEANKELIKYLSNILGLRKSDLSLDKGSKSRNKIIIINSSDGTTIMETVMEKLRTECGK